MTTPLRAFLDDIAQRTDATLERTLPAATKPPQRLHEAMRYSLFAGGKRIRPAFLVAASSLGHPDERLLSHAAAALELVHTYSLIHDDLPAMDDDTLRRGKPTCHIAFDEATAILAGDALLTLAFEVLSHDGSPPSSLRAVSILARAAGARGMVGGQMDDLAAQRGQNVDDPLTLESIHRRKTGALFGAATAIGALVGGMTEPDIVRLEQFGQQIGLAFQIADDLLDVEGVAAALGKSAGKDAAAGKLTYPQVHGVAKARLLAQNAVADAFALLGPYGDRASRLRELAEYVVSRNS